MKRFRHKGFTLVEIITVMVLVSILAVIGSGFIVSSTRAYQATQSRALLANTGRQAIERMTRQLRGALPNSVRIVNGGACVQFLPIASGGNYLQPLPDAANAAAGTALITTAPHRLDFGAAVFASVGAMSSAELYGSAPASLARLASRTDSALTLSAPKQWQRNSVSQRFYVLDNPQAFCLVGAQLRFYANLDIADAAVNLGANYDLLANSVVALGAPFGLSVGSDNRNMQVLINLGFAAGGEQVNFAQEVLIRNVP